MSIKTLLATGVKNTDLLVVLEQLKAHLILTDGKQTRLNRNSWTVSFLSENQSWWINASEVMTSSPGSVGMFPAVYVKHVPGTHFRHQIYTEKVSRAKSSTAK